jgi:hypothetical protein
MLLPIVEYEQSSRSCSQINIISRAITDMWVLGIYIGYANDEFELLYFSVAYLKELGLLPEILEYGDRTIFEEKFNENSVIYILFFKWLFYLTVIFLTYSFFCPLKSILLQYFIQYFPL